MGARTCYNNLLLLCIERFEDAGNFPVYTLGISLFTFEICFGIFELVGNEIVFYNFHRLSEFFSVTGKQKINSIDCFCLKQLGLLWEEADLQ